ncbi:hypothetical protein CH253_08175 [Rhodococcus sp. 06-156-3C]|nr:hypothetical protein CH253_08175 [Rhodococcus sp. 06-156-3C]
MDHVIASLIGAVFGLMIVGLVVSVPIVLKRRRKPEAPESVPVKPPTIEYRVSAPSAEQMRHFRSALERKAARDAVNNAARKGLARR